MTKEAEVRVRQLTNYYGWYRHKYGDVRYCPKCHTVLPKSENAPDFYVSQAGDWIEAKNNDTNGTWNCSEIYEDGARKKQRKFLKENNGYLFILLSDGKGPKNSSAYLVPWELWENEVEPYLLENGMKSIRRETTFNKDKTIRRYGADILLKDWELSWEPKIGWIIPKDHIYWAQLKVKLEIILEHIEV